MRTITEYNTGKLRIVETRNEFVIPVSRQIELGMLAESRKHTASDINYLSVTLAYHTDRCTIIGKFVFEDESGKQWKLFVPDGKPLCFPKQSTMTAFVRKNFA